ncbi:MAG TPA: GAF domain-containing protein, partial [Nitrospirota bacterium]|nr:GAF domain-containing protein [Nitrospirota bacterium]
METVMATVITEVKAFLAADYLGIYLLEGDRLRLRLSDGLPEALIGRASDWKMEEEPWLKRVVMEGKSFHAQERAGEKAGRIDEAFKREGVQAWAAVPLLAKGKVIGALTVGTFDYSGIDPGQMETLTTIGRYAGVVIENSLLYEELRLRVEDLERFRRFSVGREKRIIELKKKLGMGDNG